MTIAEYSRLKGCSRQAVLQRITRGTLEAVKVENPFVRGGWHWDIVEKPPDLHEPTHETNST